jgi:queuine tRNA-ribosyltransferase/7-cyano-7-deazaguanine tRNA-ribosyltransferase
MSSPAFKFTIKQKDKKSNARLGTLQTPHGTIQTPAFVPVGTMASVKGISPQSLKDIGTQIVLSNTYHLHLRPGEDVVEKMGGLGEFMGWDGPTMTDSGGYQVFSLGVAQRKVEIRDIGGKKLNKFSKSVFINESEMQTVLPAVTKTTEDKQKQKLKSALIKDDGVWFFSHLNGNKEWFDSEKSIKIQEKLGADLIVAFDDHESPLWDYETTKLSLERTSRWGIASIEAHKRKDQLMYGIVHGGHYEDLRVFSAKFTDKYFDAISIGGSYTSKAVLLQMIASCIPHFNEEKPRHLLGIGEIEDVFEAVALGMDFFDCVAPTRRARHGCLFIHPENGGHKKNNFTLYITNRRFQTDPEPIDPGCTCYVCQNFTRAYISHLFTANELLAYQLATHHNLYFITKLMTQIREALAEGSFHLLKAAWLGK